MSLYCLAAAVICVGAGAYRAPDRSLVGGLLLALAATLSIASAVSYF